MDYFMNESLSDVWFVIDGQRLPANKQILIFKNRVFRAMFSEGFKESKDNEVVIEDTTFEAFKTLIQFLYCHQLVLKDDKDFEHMEEVCKLTDRYDAPRLLAAICDHLKTIRLTFENMGPILKIADNYKSEELLSYVMAFIDYNFHVFAAKEDNELIELNDSTNNQFLKVLAKNYRKISDELLVFRRGKCSDCRIINLFDNFQTARYCKQCHEYVPR